MGKQVCSIPFLSPPFTNSVSLYRIGVPKNITLAKLLYEKAGELEAVYVKYGLSWATTKGVAPYLASALASMELWFLQYHSSSFSFSSFVQWFSRSEVSDDRPRPGGVLDDLNYVLFGGGVFIVLGLVRFLRHRNNRR
jgi:hypothetical protein